MTTTRSHRAWIAEILAPDHDDEPDAPFLYDEDEDRGSFALDLFDDPEALDA